MKKIFSAFLLVTMLFVSWAYAEEGPLAKLGRGVVNVVSAPVEIPKQVRAYWIEGSQYTMHISFWIFSGLVKGVAETAKRTGSGLWDIVSFPWEKPADFQPLLKPDYVFQEWPNRQDIERKVKEQNMEIKE
jgi:putative exosortase-associated protein (TIGR04073 family)